MLYEELLSQAAEMGVQVRERVLQPNVRGRYYDPARLIIIDETMPDYEKCDTLVHELSHARHRDPGCGPQYGKCERRARIETALQSIRPLEYMTAERMYEGDPFLIAQALGRTVQVVEDYRQWLHDHGL